MGQAIAGGCDMICNEICKKYKAKKPMNKSQYADGQKLCKYCDIFMKCDGLFCPCCNGRLRCNPKSKKAKALLGGETRI